MVQAEMTYIEPPNLTSRWKFLIVQSILGEAGTRSGEMEIPMICPKSRIIHPFSPGPGPRSGRKFAAFFKPLYPALTATSLARHLSANNLIRLVHQPAPPVLAHPSLPSSSASCCVSLTKVNLPVVRCPRGSTRGGCAQHGWDIIIE